MPWFFLGFLVAGTWTGNPYVGLGAGLLAWWLFIQLHPWTGCWWCHESAKRRDASGKNWHFCVVCGGSGRRRRLFAMRRKGDR